MYEYWPAPHNYFEVAEVGTRIVNLSHKNREYCNIRRSKYVMSNKMYEKKMDQHILKVIRDKFLFRVLDSSLTVAIHEAYAEEKIAIELEILKEAEEEAKK